MLKQWRSFGRHRSRDSVQPPPRPSVSEAVWLTRAGASASNEPAQVAARLWDNLTHLHRDTCWSSSSQTKHQSQTGRELSSRYSQHTTAHIVFIQWMHLIIIIFFLHHIAAASHVISDYNSLHHQVSVCQEPQAAYYSITLLYIGCWQLNTWIHERREHSKWTSKSKKPKNYKKKKNRETRNIRKLYDWMCLM